jgi:hypothetical protein
MPNTTVPANAILLSADGCFDRRAIMRRAWALARMFRDDEARAYRNRHSGALQHGGEVPPLALPPWLQCMSDALAIAWREARTERAMTPAIAAEIEAAELAVLSVRCIDRPSPADIAQLAAVQAHASALRAALHA